MAANIKLSLCPSPRLNALGWDDFARELFKWIGSRGRASSGSSKLNDGGWVFCLDVYSGNKEAVKELITDLREFLQTWGQTDFELDILPTNAPGYQYHVSDDFWYWRG